MADAEKQAQLDLTCSKLSLTADNYASLVPAISRISMKKLQHENKLMAHLPPHICCKNCSSLFRPGNFNIKIKRKMKMNKKISNLIKRCCTKGEKSLGCFQRNLLQNFYKSTTNVIIFCKCCQKKNRISCPTKPDKTIIDSGTTKKDTSKATKKRMRQKLRRIAKTQDLEQNNCGLNIDGKASMDTALLTIEPEKAVKIHAVASKKESFKVKPEKTSFNSFIKISCNESKPNVNADNKHTKKKVQRGKTLSSMLEEEKLSSNSTSSVLERFFSSMSS